jgi:hypothetical protein
MGDRSSRLAVVVLVLVTVAAAPVRRAHEPPPSADQMYAAFENADYAKVLKQVAAALALKGDAAEAYDRYELLVLRGEAYLRTENTAAAAAAFDEAAKHTKLEEKAAVARATAELVRRARKRAYTPPPAKKGDAPEPIDVTDPAARRQAFALMFDDARPRVAAEVKAARASTTLAPVTAALAMLRDLRALEVAAGAVAPGADDAGGAAAAMSELVERVGALTGRAVEQMSDRVGQLEATAGVPYDMATPGRDDSGRRVVRYETGVTQLTRDQVKELRTIVKECTSVRRALAGVAAMVIGPGNDPSRAVDGLAVVADSSDRVRARARQLLHPENFMPPQRSEINEDELRTFNEMYSRPGTNWVRKPIRPGDKRPKP